MSKIYRVCYLVIAVLLFTSLMATARTRDGKKSIPKPTTAALPAEELRVHNVGKFWLSVSNYGIFGSQSGELKDPCTRASAPSAEFPAGTGVSYLFQGAIWIGAIKGEGSEAETLVSVGNDGWFGDIFEMTADLPFLGRTIRPTGLQQGSCFNPFSDSAVSEQDFIAVYTDTVTDPSLVHADNFDGPFQPLGLKITQESYAWSYDYAEDFILFDYTIENIGDKLLNGVYMALYIDADNHNPELDGPAVGAQDDVSGFKHAVPSFRCPETYEDTLNIAWTGDNDGFSMIPDNDDNQQGIFLPHLSPTSVAGTRIVKAPGPVQTSFNWWNSWGDPPFELDWGPWTRENFNRRPGGFGDNNFGTPVGNPSKYFIMSNNEFDYDQLKAALPVWEDSGWMPAPPGLAGEIADGYDTRYLLSFGPFRIQPGESLPLTLAYIAGEDFHVKPADWQAVKGKFDQIGPVTKYLDTLLNFTDFATNARWAGWVYDNPGVDTDSNGFRGRYRICQGDTVYFEGDSVPDFTGPPPPLAPELEFETSDGKVGVRWNGYKIETNLDYFSNEADFEGYRIYLSRTGFTNDYALLDSYDKIDLRMFVYSPSTKKWVLKATAIPPDSAVRLFAQDNACCYQDFDGSCTCLDSTLCLDPFRFGSDPLTWTFANPYVFKGFCGTELEISPSLKLFAGDTIAFQMEDWNKDLEAIRVYRDSSYITPESLKYYEYEYLIDDLNPSSPVHIAVSAFDYGNPQTGLAPLETSVLVNSKEVWPLPSPSSIGDKKVVVFPNPYKITETYPGEDRNLPSGKRIHFVQLPGNCTIRIFTLDGDQIAEIKTDPLNPEQSELNWNLISSNGQEVVAGVYIFHVESKKGNQIGKFVIVK